MLKSYFYIPANNKTLIESRDSIESNFLIFDFDASIPVEDKEGTLDKFPAFEISEKMYACPDIPKGITGRLDTTYLSGLISIGFTKFVLPKINTVGELQVISDYISTLHDDFEFILLVENPMCLLNLNDILKSHKLNITGLALESHDYVESLGMEYTIKNLFFARQYILNAAKAYGLTSIDLVSMDKTAGRDFEDECKEALSIGYDAKLFNAESQLSRLHTMEFFSKEEIAEARKIYKKIQELKNENLSVIKLEGQIYERSHLLRIKKMVEWDDKFSHITK